MRLAIVNCTLLVIFVTVGSSWNVRAADDPTLYQYYTSGGIHSGLSADGDQFTLNGKHFVIYSGSFHYFRVVPEHWRAVLQRFKAAGLNTVQTYLAWNLHEETEGHIDFESPMLNLAKFLDEIKQADMFAILRIGPFIAAEWDLGGLPAWLLSDPHMALRSNYKPYLDKIAKYWQHVMKIVNPYQFSTSGGPVIMMQIENEYFNSVSSEYMNFLHDFLVASGFKQLLFAQTKFETKNIFPHHDVLETVHLNSKALEKLTALKVKHPNRPGFVSEFWTGWYDSWHNKHHAKFDLAHFEHELTDILFSTNSSVNFYMFIGGTNFGFMNGQRIVTSYDYDAPLSESGNYTEKYWKVREFYQKMVQTGRLPKTRLPEAPKVPLAQAHPKVSVQHYLPFEVLLGAAKKFTNIHKSLTMEQLPEKQNFGFILYRAEYKEIHNFEITGHIQDRAILLVDSVEIAVVDDGITHFNHTFTTALANGSHKYDVMVENQGRRNYGNLLNVQHKGISGDIKLDDVAFLNFTIYSLDFKEKYISALHALNGWLSVGSRADHHSPGFYTAQLKIDEVQPRDTFLELTGWHKGNVFVNGFNIGRYWAVGPQKTLYIPGPLLRQGLNTIDIFELHKPGSELIFLNHSILE